VEHSAPESSDTPSPAAVSGTEVPDPATAVAESENDLLGQLAAAKAEAQGHYDRYLRAAAELDNFRKRKDRELAELRLYANHQLLKDLLAILDNLERALGAAQEADESASLREGVEMTRNALLKVMGEYGVMPVEAVDRPFDPSLHEAVMQAPHDTLPDNTVIRELQKGYLLHDRLLRPAMVVVSKGST
jgi:molecular chaperone GrpE